MNFSTQFKTENNQLLFGGQTLARLALRAGQTPFYAYSRNLIQERIRSLRAQLDPNVHLHYAIKANPMPALVQFVAREVHGLDVASGGELHIALNAGGAPLHMSFAGPGKREAELAQALATGVLIHLESEHQARMLSALSQKLNLPARVSLRVNPDFELKTAGMRMGGGAKPFGIDAEAIPALLRQLPALQLNFEGFHCFSGSQNLQADALIEAHRASYALLCQLAEHAPAPVRSFNLGSGFGIPYFSHETALPLAPVLENLNALAHKAQQDFPEAHLVLELGRYLVGEAGIYVTRIVDKKISRGQIFYVCDGGLNHHLAASGNFGQVIRKDYPVAIGNKMNIPINPNPASLVGPLCTPLDILTNKTPLPDAEIGDFVVVFQSGAYGASASPQGFLSHPGPVEILVD